MIYKALIFALLCSSVAMSMAPKVLEAQRSVVKLLDFNQGHYEDKIRTYMKDFRKSCGDTSETSFSECANSYMLQLEYIAKYSKRQATKYIKNSNTTTLDECVHKVIAYNFEENLKIYTNVKYCLHKSLLEQTNDLEINDLYKDSLSGISVAKQLFGTNSITSSCVTVAEEDLEDVKKFVKFQVSTCFSCGNYSVTYDCTKPGSYKDHFSDIVERMNKCIVSRMKTSQVKKH